MSSAAALPTLFAFTMKVLFALRGGLTAAAVSAATAKPWVLDFAEVLVCVCSCRQSFH
jgi:hypothetical protein